MIWDITRELFSPERFMPHGDCYLWQTQLIWLHVVSNSLIALAYYSIPAMLIYFVRKREDVPFRSIFFLFSAFIIACGTTYIIDVWTIWHPAYWLSGLVKGITALVSGYTALKLLPLVPKALTLASLTQLEAINLKLEERVKQRTTELYNSNQELEREIAERKQKEERLWVLERAIAASSNGIVITDATQEGLPIVYINPAFESITGYSAQEVIGKNCRFLQGQETNQEPLQKLRTALQECRECNVVLRNYRKDGNLFWNDLYISPVKDESGNLTHYIGVQADITERKQAQEALQESEEKFRQLAENLEEVFWMVDAQTKDVIYISPKCNKLWGCCDEEKLSTSKSFQEFIHPEDKEQVQRAIELHSQSGEYDQEFRIICPNGKIRWIHDRAFPVKNGAGEVYRIAGIAEDITKRKQYEAALEQERQQLKEIITQAPVAMAMLDTQMRYIAYSNKLLQDYNLGDADLRGHSHYEVFPDLLERWKEDLKRVLKGESLSYPEDVWQRADGSTLYLHSAFHPWHTPNGSVGGIVIVSHQINELVEARETALEASRMKSQFLANMSHEIRTPMNGVLGMTDLLLETPLNAQQLNFVQTISESAKNLLLIINDILDLSKLEAGEMNIETFDFNLSNCVEEVVDLLAAEAQIKGLGVFTLIESDISLELKGDGRRLRQILTNLVGNGIKFTETGEVIIRVSPIVESRQNIKLRFEVKDTGIGIPKSEQKKLFQAFSQIDTSTTRTHGGTGLGLVICKQLVELMGGEIGVQSKLGEGTTFWFTVQFTKQSPPVNSAVLRERHLDGLKLLVVDSNTTSYQVIQSCLDPYNIQVKEVQTTQAAISILRQAALDSKPYDVALVDLQSPQVNGETLGQLIKYDPVLRNVKWIVMVSIRQHEEVKNLLWQGASDYLLKPIRASQLLDCLTNTFYLKSKNPSPSPFTYRHKPPINPHKNLELKILLVEDTPTNQKVLLSQFEMLGYRADCVGDGKAALERLSEQDYDLVFMDCLMPILDGYKTTQAIRKKEGQSRHTIIIAITANAMKGEKEKCLEWGMDDYISKPITLEILATMINLWFPKTNKNISSLNLILEEAQVPSPKLVSAHLNSEEKFITTTTITNMMVDQETPFNLPRLEEISRGNKDFQREMMQIFLEDAPVYLYQIKQSLEQGDLEGLAVNAHQLKGAAAMVAIKVMPDLALKLETDARSQELQEAPDIITQLEQIFDQVQLFVKTF